MSRWLSGASATSASFTGSPGRTYCFSARATDQVGNTSAWSAERCTSVPLDDRSLATSAGNWTRGTGTAYYLGTVTGSTERGATLSLKGVEGSRLALLATTGPSMGTLKVSWKGEVLAKISLDAPQRRKRQLFVLAPFPSTETGTVTIKVVSTGARVQIDGFGVKR